MNERTTGLLTRTALVLTAAWVAWSIYGLAEAPPSGPRLELEAAARALADADYATALRLYDARLATEPDNLPALRGSGQALLLLGRPEAALTAFDRAIALAPGFGVTWANRGIARDRLGDHAGALADYETALRLEPGVAEGPGFLTRFLRNQAERPPTVADRARYLRAELAKPAAERHLRHPELDAAQRPYTL